MTSRRYKRYLAQTAALFGFLVIITAATLYVGLGNLIGLPGGLGNPTLSQAGSYKIEITYDRGQDNVRVADITAIEEKIADPAGIAFNSLYSMQILDAEGKILHSQKIIINDTIYYHPDHTEKKGIAESAEVRELPQEIKSTVFLPYFPDATKVEIIKQGEKPIAEAIPDRHQNLATVIDAPLFGTAGTGGYKIAVIGDGFANSGAFNSAFNTFVGAVGNEAPYGDIFEFIPYEGNASPACTPNILACIQSSLMQSVLQSTRAATGANGVVVLVNGGSTSAAMTGTGPAVINVNHAFAWNAKHEFLGHMIGKLNDRYNNAVLGGGGAVGAINSNCSTSPNGESWWPQAGSTGAYPGCQAPSLYAPFPNDPACAYGGTKDTIMSNCQGASTGFDSVETYWIQNHIIPNLQNGGGGGSGGGSFCTCDGTDSEGNNFVGLCGQPACGSDLQVYKCESDGFYHPQGGSCGGAGSCSCRGTDHAGNNFLGMCGQTVCGTDFKKWTCTNGQFVATGIDCASSTVPTQPVPTSGGGSCTGGWDCQGNRNVSRPHGGTVCGADVLEGTDTVPHTYQCQNTQWVDLGPSSSCANACTSGGGGGGGGGGGSGGGNICEQACKAYNSNYCSDGTPMTNNQCQCIYCGPTVTSAPNPTATNTPVPPTATNTPIPPTATTAPGQPTATATPTVGGTQIAASLKIVGLGTNTAAGQNSNPVKKTKTGQIAAFNSSGQKVAEGSGTFTTLTVAGNYDFKGTISLTNISTGAYIIKARLDNTLWKNLGLHNITASQTLTLPSNTLISGDINPNNTLDLIDYNTILSCYGTKPCSQKEKADFNIDGKVDEKDLNIFYDALTNRQGD